MKVKDLMRTNYVTITHDTHIRDVNRILHQYNLKNLLIINDSDELVGIVTYSDLFRHLLPNYNMLLLHNKIEHNPEKIEDMAVEIFNKPVEEIMTKEPETVTPDLPILEAGALMLAHKVKQMPVIDNGKLVGIINHTDITWGLLLKDSKFFT